MTGYPYIYVWAFVFIPQTADVLWLQEESYLRLSGYGGSGRPFDSVYHLDKRLEKGYSTKGDIATAIDFMRNLFEKGDSSTCSPWIGFTMRHMY